jgi:hypothetical protein
MSEHRIQQLIAAGVAERSSDFTKEARQVINDLSDDEFNSILSIRDKIYAEGGQPAGHHYDTFVCFFA